MKSWLAHRTKRLTRVQQVVTGVTAAIVLVCGGAALYLAVENSSLSGDKRDLARENRALTARNSELEGENAGFVAVNEAAKARASMAERDAQTAWTRAKKRANGIIRQGELKLRARGRRLTDREAALNARDAELDERAAAIGQQEQTIEQSTFGDGAYLVGTDIPAGSYRTDGGEGCYWARKNGSDIIDNSFASGPARTTVNDGELFETQGCGTWGPG